MDKKKLEQKYLNNSISYNNSTLSDVFKIPNLLTIFRIFMTPFLILSLFSFYSQQKYELPVLFGSLMLLSDLLDGYFARKLNQTTFLGMILDPLSDKIIILSLGFTLYHLGYNIPLWLLWMLVFRDILILFFGIFLIKRFSTILKPMIITRLTPFSWGLYYIMLVIGNRYLIISFAISSIVLTLISGFLYLHEYLALMKNGNRK